MVTYFCAWSLMESCCSPKTTCCFKLLHFSEHVINTSLPETGRIFTAGIWCVRNGWWFTLYSPRKKYGTSLRSCSRKICGSIVSGHGHGHVIALGMTGEKRWRQKTWCGHSRRQNWIPQNPKVLLLNRWHLFPAWTKPWTWLVYDTQKASSRCGPYLYVDSSKLDVTKSDLEAIFKHQAFSPRSHLPIVDCSNAFFLGTCRFAQSKSHCAPKKTWGRM